MEWTGVPGALGEPAKMGARRGGWRVALLLDTMDAMIANGRGPTQRELDVVLGGCAMGAMGSKRETGEMMVGKEGEAGSCRARST